MKQHEATPLLQTREFHQTTSLREMTWVDKVNKLEQLEELPSKKVYLHSVLMGLASFTNVVGGFFAIASGADQVKQEDNSLKTNPFFYTAMATSLIYFGANAIEVHRLWQERVKKQEEINEKHFQATELTGVEIHR